MMTMIVVGRLNSLRLKLTGYALLIRIRPCLKIFKTAKTTLNLKY